jgi:thymidylate synthase ThyX
MSSERRYNTESLPLTENLEKFAVPYMPEKFAREEKEYLKPFFTNVDKPIFAAHNLPEEVLGAISSRYSRATKGVRRIFLDEYIGPIINPESQKDWETLSQKDKNKAQETRDNFKEWIAHMNETGGIDEVVNVQRGRKFFDKWLAEYGDDSIAEMGGVHLFIEGMSNIVVNEIEAKRIGISPIEKSSRYVQFWEKRSDGKYQYVVPGELKGTPEEKLYTEAMDSLFDIYANIAQPYLDYIKEIYPKDEDETDRSFEGSRSAKRFDDIRDLLPFATQTSVALHGNGRAFEDLVNRLAAHPIGEVRWTGQQIEKELSQVVPSFVTRPMTPRGAEIQLYRQNLEVTRQELADKVEKEPSLKFPRWSNIETWDPNAEVEVLASFMLRGSKLSIGELRKEVGKWSARQRREAFDAIFAERDFDKDPKPERQELRFRKVPRAFENAEYLISLWARGGDFRDLHRHRQATQERQRFSVQWGYDLEQEVLSSPFEKQIVAALEKAAKASEAIAKKNPDIAQYAVPFGYVQHWYMNLSAREIYWMAELRTGPQGREHYRQVVQDMVRKVTVFAPNLFAGIKTDWGSYALSRRESEKKIEKKLESLEK